MVDTNGLVDFHNWCVDKSISYDLSFSEAENVWEVRIVSPAPAERYYMKRCYDLESFMRKWEEHVQEELKKPLAEQGKKYP